MLTRKAWLLGMVALCAIVGITSAPALKKKLAFNAAESKCMKILEATAQASKTKTAEGHAEMVFKAMATPECKELNALAKTQ